ncbi:hypothetical protein FSP39_022001 [Pinctada imbricata]|uniref:RBR-type E3 ubiquitin transferase n=1 Tax=Pinctada imbricata TaxID=66713 RepID=A0AA88Y0P5_PINIB|nr:hypothetical protein FSP39_022001 [Pinctada imbricata]
MVQKCKKSSVHSGNTLRSFNNRYNRCYRLQSCLVRQATRPASKTLLDDLDISCDHVAYSLNKKGRWRVPLLLKEHILLRPHEEDRDTPLKVSELHKLKRRANCVGFFATKGSIRKHVPMRKTYFDPTTFQNPQSKENENDDSDSSKEERPFNQEAEVSVNIYYPCPKSSSITHNAKYLQPQSEQDEYNFHQRKIAPNSKKEKQKTNRKHFKVNDFDDDLYDEFSEEEADPIYDSDDEMSQYLFSHPDREDKSSFTAEDVLNQALKTQTLWQPPRTDKEQNLETKAPRNIVYEPVPLNTTVTTTSPNVPAHKPVKEKLLKVTPAMVMLPRREVLNEYLDFIYGANYIECECVPRSFIIDVTDTVKESIRNSKTVCHLRHRIDFAATLVFTYYMAPDLTDSDFDMYLVSLNAKLKMRKLDMNDMIDFGETSIDDIMARVCNFYQKLPASNFYMLPKIPVNLRKTTFENLQACHGSTSEYYHISQRQFFQTLVDASPNDKCQSSNVISSLSVTKPTICFICFEDISEEIGQTFCLQECGHWFCTNCWQDHIITGLENGIREIRCPEYKCNTRVTSSFMLSLLNLRLVEKFVIKAHDLEIEEDQLRKWCPNPQCGRVLSISKNAKCLNVSCACGMEVCFDCLQPAHWPATCKQSMTYWRTLKSNGHDVDFDEYNAQTVKVSGKNCPVCNRFIEKNGGCYYMTCVCGSSFCWGCGKPYPGHQMTSDCDQNKKGDKHNNKTMTVRHIKRRQIADVSPMYQKAVENRVGRLETRYGQIKSAHRGIMKRLGEISRGSELRVRELLLDYNVTGNKNTTTTEKIRDFLSTTLSVYVEMRYLAEYTSVYVQHSSDAKSQRVSVVKEISHRLNTLGNDIYSTMCKHKDKDITAVLADLWSLRQLCKTTVNGLVRNIRR